MSNLSQFFSSGASIKSIQRGTISWDSTMNTGTATITAVNTNKTELRYLGGSGFEQSTFECQVPRLTLTNSTTITASTTYNGAATVSWELTEWN